MSGDPLHWNLVSVIHHNQTLHMSTCLCPCCVCCCTGPVGCCVGHQVDTPVGLSPADHRVCVQQCGHVPRGHRPGPSAAHDWRHSGKVKGPHMFAARQTLSSCCHTYRQPRLDMGTNAAARRCSGAGCSKANCSDSDSSRQCTRAAVQSGCAQTGRS